MIYQVYGKQLSINIENFKKRYLSGVSFEELSKDLHCSKSTIYRLVKFLNLSRARSKSQREAKYNIDHNYFEKIDTEDKAYFLGLLYADGSVAKKTNSIKLSLKESDKHILDLFNKFLKNESPIRFTKKTKETYSNMYSLMISSQKIKENLIDKGCVPLKTFLLRWPCNTILPEYLVRHFVRGYFDGDGCFSYRKHQGKYLKPAFNIVSTVDFCNGLINLFKRETNCNCYMQKRYKNRNTNTRQLEISGSKQIISVMDWLYAGATIFIQRKRDKYLFFLKEYHTIQAKSPNRYRNTQLSQIEIDEIKKSTLPVKLLSSKYNISRSKIYKICQA